MNTRVLSKNFSRLLNFYYSSSNHFCKVRCWEWLQKTMNYPRLLLPYAEKGWITIDYKDCVQREILTKGSYEIEVYNALEPYLLNQEVIWDVGAHIGSFSIRALGSKKVKEIHAFEPNPSYYQILNLNLSLNKGVYKTYQNALSDQEETKPLFGAPNENTGLSSLKENGYQQVSGQIMCKTADQIVFQEGVAPPTLLKIDVEGWELPVLKGMRRILQEIPPKAFVFEADSNPDGAISDRSIPDYLKQFNYETKRIKRPSGIIDKKENYLASIKNDR